VSHKSKTKGDKRRKQRETRAQAVGLVQRQLSTPLLQSSGAKQPPVGLCRLRRPRGFLGEMGQGPVWAILRT
jgi:hypothetical protein